MLIAQISDPHVKMPGRLAYRRVRYGGRPEEYEHLKSILAPLGQRILAVPGNHDHRDAMRAAFADGDYLPHEASSGGLLEKRFAQ